MDDLRLLLLSVLLPFAITCQAQLLPDSVIGNEIATIRAATVAKTTAASGLQEIRLNRCSSDFVLLTKGNLYDYELTVDVHSTTGEASPTVSEVIVSYGRYGRMTLPDSALVDIDYPVFCGRRGKKDRSAIRGCRVFRSTDKQRVYISQMYGNPTHHEVIWIVRNWQYVGRVIDGAPTP